MLAKACSSNHRKKRESRVRDTVQSLNALGSRAVGEGSESLQLLTSPSILLQALHRCKGEEQAGTSGQNRVLHYVLVQGKLGGVRAGLGETICTCNLGQDVPVGREPRFPRLLGSPGTSGL